MINGNPALTILLLPSTILFLSFWHLATSPGPSNAIVDAFFKNRWFGGALWESPLWMPCDFFGCISCIHPLTFRMRKK